MTSNQLRLFCGLLLVIALPLAWRCWQLLPLYIDSETRNDVRTALTDVADREGWLLSDIQLLSIDSSSATLVHREHRRGSDTSECFRLTIADSSLAPCDAES